MGQPTRYRQPWAPTIPSTLGMPGATMHSMVPNNLTGGVKLDQDKASDHGVENKTNPATPVKVEDKSVSPSRLSTRDE